MPQDEQPENKIRDNVSPVLKPKNVRHNDLAPPGMLGTRPAHTISQTAPPENTPQPVRGNRPQNQLGKPEQEHTDTRPIAVRTRDAEVDSHTAKTHRLVDAEELNRLKKEAIKKKLQNDRNQNRDRER